MSWARALGSPPLKTGTDFLFMCTGYNYISRTFNIFWVWLSLLSFKSFVLDLLLMTQSFEGFECFKLPNYDPAVGGNINMLPARKACNDIWLWYRLKFVKSQFNHFRRLLYGKSILIGKSQTRQDQKIQYLFRNEVTSCRVFFIFMCLRIC